MLLQDLPAEQPQHEPLALGPQPLPLALALGPWS